MELKKTLLLPQTDFEMRASLAKKEPKIIQWWNDEQIYNKLLEKNANNEFFFLHDGPPYANGNIHVGHALNKILKDFVIKSKLMQGYNAPFIPGWDTHGLPIEQKITESGVDRKTLPTFEFRQKCHSYALEQIAIQKNQMLRLGLFGRFDKPYITLDKEYESKQVELFFTMYEKGLIFKGLKPIYWSPSSESALAEAEIEYHDKMSPSIYVKFEITKGTKVISPGDNILIWTTTPWTIPANVGVAVDTKLKYSLVEFKDTKLVVASALVDDISEKLETKLKVVSEFTGNDIIGVEYKHPLLDRVCKVVAGHHVTTESGTGIVHMAPSHGEDDFAIGKDNNLEVFNYIDDKGYFISEAPIAAGEFWLDANKTVGEKLQEVGALLKLEFIKHSYPHDWRTKKPVMYKATPQWFGSIEKIRPQIMKAISNVEWIPDWGMNRLGKMMEGRNDWCISRQRVWGVPIPIVYGENKQPILDKKLNKHFVNLFAIHGSNIWFEKDIADLLPEGYSHEYSPNGQFKKETDIMDVWFDSGSSFKAVMESNGYSPQASMYLEGSDQYRGWFNSSLITSVAISDQAPYKSVLSHGFVLDGKGEKMSKSKGNTIDPLKIIETNGADILRLWVASTKYQSDVRISEEIMKQTSEYYRGIRFKIRFALSNLFDFKLEENASTDLELIDKFMLIRLNQLTTTVNDSYRKYDFGLIFNEVNNFLNELSTEYFDFAKDILYVKNADHPRRRAIQTVLYHFVDSITKVLAPILPFTTEEAYKHFDKSNKQTSIFLEGEAQRVDISSTEGVVESMEQFLKLKANVQKEIENQRTQGVVGKPAEVELTISPKADFKAIFNISNIKDLLMVSKINVVESNDFDGVEYDTAFIKVVKREGQACPRCRFIKPNSQLQNEACDDCMEIINS